MKKRILCLCSLAVICLLGCGTNAETKTEINDYEKHDFVEYRDSNDYNYHITEDNETNDDYDCLNDYDSSSSYSIDLYDKGHEDVMEDDDYDDDLYYSDEDYEMGVDDAMEDYYDEYGEEW